MRLRVCVCVCECLTSVELILMHIPLDVSNVSTKLYDQLLHYRFNTKDLQRCALNTLKFTILHEPLIHTYTRTHTHKQNELYCMQTVGHHICVQVRTRAMGFSKTFSYQHLILTEGKTLISIFTHHSNSKSSFQQAMMRLKPFKCNHMIKVLKSRNEKR